MVHFRRFRNTDPPRLVEMWKETFTGRGAVPLLNSSPLDRFVFAKPFFDPAGLILAEEDGVCVGFAHAGFGVEPGTANLRNQEGVICLVGVRPAFQRRGIATGLVRECEGYLRQRGAQTIYAGSYRPLNPFYQGLYGGSETAGLLDSDQAAGPFFHRQGYEVCQTIRILNRRLKDGLKLADPRFATHRQRFELRMATPKAAGDWWQECVFNVVEPLVFYLEEKATSTVTARTLVWEMEGFSCRWNQPAIGLVNVEVPPAWRRQGLAKYLLALILRHIQEQFFEIAELHVAEDNPAGLALAGCLGFEQVDVGRVYKK